MNNLYILFFLLIIILILIICSIIIQDVCYRGGIKGGATAYEKMQEQMQRVDDLRQNIEKLKKKIENRVYDNEDDNVQYVRSNTENLQDLENDNAFDHYEVTTHQGNYKPGDQIDLETLQELIRKGNVPDGHPIYKKKIFGGTGANDFIAYIIEALYLNLTSENSSTFKNLIEFYIQNKKMSIFSSWVKNQYFDKILELLNNLLKNKAKYYNAMLEQNLEKSNKIKFIESDLNKGLLEKYYNLLIAKDTDIEIHEIGDIFANSNDGNDFKSRLKEYIQNYIPEDANFSEFKDRIDSFRATEAHLKLFDNIESGTDTRYIKEFLKTSRNTYFGTSQSLKNINMKRELLYLVAEYVCTKVGKIPEYNINQILKKYYRCEYNRDNDNEQLVYIQDVVDKIDTLTDTEIIDEVREIIELETVKSIMENIEERRNKYESNIVEFKSKIDDNSLFPIN